jgi:integrase
MKKVGKPSGLTRRKGSASWYLRQRVPLRFRKLNGPVEIWLSLDTAVYAAALTKLDWARQEMQQRFLDNVQVDVLTPPLTGIYRRAFRADWPVAPERPCLPAEAAAPLARAFFNHSRRGLDLETSISKANDPGLFDQQLVELQDRLAQLRDPVDEADHTFGGTIWALDHGGFQSEYSSDERLLLANYISRAMIEIASIALARLLGDYSDSISDSLFLVTDDVATAALTIVEHPPASNMMSLDTLVDRWAKERGVLAKGIAKHRAVTRWLIERVGDRNVQEITKKDVLKFKDAMVNDGVTPANANAKLACLRTLLNFAVRNDLRDANPADRIKVLDKDKERRKRKEFDPALLHALFSSPVYAADERPIQGRGEAAYWLPLIALFTGARLEEIAQLRPKDIRKEEYIDGDDLPQQAWVIGIFQEGELGKNAWAERRVPVHPELEKLGLIRFAAEALAKRQKQLFPALKQNIYGKFGAKWGEWWSGYRRDICGIDDRRVVFHSFRHTFKYYARHVAMVDGIQRQIMGHSPGDTADEYGPSRYSLDRLVEGMKLYRVPGLKLPLPPPPYR